VIERMVLMRVWYVIVMVVVVVQVVEVWVGRGRHRRLGGVAGIGRRRLVNGQRRTRFLT